MRQSDIKLSISNIAWLAEQDETVYKYMHQFHFEGVEVAPTRIFPEDPYGKLNLAELWQRELHLCNPSGMGGLRIFLHQKRIVMCFSITHAVR